MVTMEMVTARDPIRILLVEDEFLIAEWVAQALSEQGFAVHAVSDARAALRHLAAAPVDALFTDVNLPGGMDGAALARHARELVPDLPVVYASARFAALGIGERVPGALFVPKPYEPNEVGRLLASLVESTKATLVPELA
jgi:DNA-binding response OmpR family regulator